MGRILIVDDEDDMRYLVRQVLEKAGHVVAEACNGEECFEKVRGFSPDLVLLDIMMPGLDGWEVLGRLQEDPELRSIPVIMFTVKPLTPATLRERELQGLVNYIVKPFSKDGLVNAISQALESVSKARVGRRALEKVGSEVAEEYERVSKQLVLHRNFLSLFRSILRERKEDGSMDDIQSFEDVVRSESMLIKSYEDRKRELERLMKGS